jgi:hypothetical protein
MMFCKSCGTPVEPGAHFCAACGKPVSVAASPSVSPAVAAATLPISDSALPPLAAPALPAAHPAGNAITWPFHQANWFSSLWMVLLGWLPLPMPMTINFGWLLDAAGRRGRGETELLPKAHNLPRIYLHGLIFWLMVVLYFVIPLALLGMIYASEVAQLSAAFDEWLATWFLNLGIQGANAVIAVATDLRIGLYPQPSLVEFFVDAMERYAAVIWAPMVYCVLAFPLFLAGSVRFAITGKARSYFQVLHNFRIVVGHLPRFLWVLVLLFALNLMLMSVGIIGALLWLTAAVWIAAYLAGNLAAAVAVHPAARQ